MARVSRLNEQFAANPAFEAGQSRARMYLRIGMELRKLREEMGLNQEELARRTGLDQGDISRIETGKWGKRGLNYAVLDRVLPVFGLHLSHEVRPLPGAAAGKAQLARAAAMTRLLHTAE